MTSLRIDLGAERAARRSRAPRRRWRRSATGVREWKPSGIGLAGHVSHPKPAAAGRIVRTRQGFDDHVGGASASSSSTSGRPARRPARAPPCPPSVRLTTERRRSVSERWRATSPRRSSSSITGTTCAGSSPHSPASSCCDGGASALSTARTMYWRPLRPDRGQRVLRARRDLVAELDQQQRGALDDAAGKLGHRAAG